MTDLDSESDSDLSISPARVRSMLREWERWVTWPEPIGPAPATCGSLESQYLPPQCWESPEPRPIEPDWRIGSAIEAIVRNLPPPYPTALRVWYIVLGPYISTIKHDPYEVAARRMHLPSARRYADLLIEAEELVRRKLITKTS